MGYHTGITYSELAPTHSSLLIQYSELFVAVCADYYLLIRIYY
jgi:hypothetical protein